MANNTEAKKPDGVLFSLTFDSVPYQAEPHRPLHARTEAHR